VGFAAVVRRQGIFAVPVEVEKTGSGSDWARRDTRKWEKSFELRKRVEPKVRSGREEAGNRLAMEFGRDECGPKRLSLSLLCLGFQAQSPKGVKDVAGKEGDQQETLHGVGVVLENVIGLTGPLYGGLSTAIG
jgi:hypothetical protein